jgi:RNA polymerase-interacting CarD/CdnL/TRCF family regulator
VPRTFNLRGFMKTFKQYIKRKTKVYSLEHGAGEVVGILKLYDGIEDYIEVQFLGNNGDVKIFPNRFQNDLRITSTPLELTKNLKGLHAQIVQTDYSEVRVSYRKIGVDMNLEIIVKMIARLVGRIDLKLSEKNLLSQCMESLILEVGHVCKINEECARGVVSDYIRAA